MQGRNVEFSFSSYARSFMAFTGTLGALFFVKTTGVLSSYWLGSENEEDHTSNNDLSMRSYQKRELSPEVQSSLIEGDFLSLFSTAGKPEHITIQDKYAFISEGSAGLEIVDISNGSYPVKVGSYQTNSFIHEVKISGSYAYLAADTAGLNILDIRNINNLSLAGVYMTDVPVTGVVVANNKAFLTDSSSGQYQTIDVSNPSSVLHLRLSIVPEVVSNGIIYKIINTGKVVISGNFAYTLISYGPSSSLCGSVLNIIDVSDRFRPLLLSAYYFNYTSGSGCPISDLKIVGTVAYISLGANDARIEFIDISTPANPQFIGKYASNCTRFLCVGNFVVGHLAVSENIMYVIQGSAQQTLAIVDISTLAQPILKGNYTSNVTINDQRVSGKTVYLATKIGLTILDVNDPAVPFELASYMTPSEVYGIEIDGNFAYLRINESLMVIDVSNPNVPSLRGNFFSSLISPLFMYYQVPNTGLSISQNVAYVSNPAAGVMLAIDINNPATPVLKQINTLYPISYGSSYKLAAFNVIGNIAYILGDIFHIVDISQPNNFVDYPYVASQGISSTAQSDSYMLFTQLSLGLMLIDLNTAFISRYVPNNPGVKINSLASVNKIIYSINTSALNIIDMNNLNAPVLINSYSLSSANASNIVVSEGIAYIATNSGLQLINISNAMAPVLLNFYNGSFYSVGMTNHFIYTATSNSNNIQILDATRLTNLSLSANYQVPVLPTQPSMGISSIGCSATTAIIATPNLLFFDVSYPDYPILVFAFNTTDNAYIYSGTAASIAISGDIACIANRYNPFIGIVDISYSSAPVFLGYFSLQLGRSSIGQTQVTTISISENIAYCVDRAGDLFVFDAQIGQRRFPMPVPAMRVAANDEYAYVADVAKMLHIIDLKTPALVEVASYTLSNVAQAMIVSGDFLYIAEAAAGVEVIDISNPISPRLAGRITNSLTNARTLNIVDNQYLYVGDGLSGLVVFSIPEKLVMVNNQLTVAPNQIVTITLADIGARDTRQAGFYPPIAFSISNISNGQFVFANNSNQAIVQFTQQDVINGLVQFQSTGLVAPNYWVSAIYGNITTVPTEAVITFDRIHELPNITNNQFFIDQGEINELTSNNLSATVPISGMISSLQFTVNNIGNGFFQYAARPNIFVSQFMQGDIIAGSVQFVYLGSGLEQPFFEISVSDGPVTTGFINGSINFDAAPQLLNNRLTIGDAETVVVTAEYLQAFDYDSNNASLIFGVSNVVHGEFFSSSNGVNNTAVVKFIQQDISDGLIHFKHDGSGIAPGYVVSVSDGRITIRNQTPSILFNNKNGTVIGSNTPAIVGGVVSGVAGLGALAAGIGFFVKRGIDKSTRNENRLAAFLWDELQIQGTENFKTAQGKKYVLLIKNELEPQLKDIGYDTEKMEDLDLRELAKKIAMSAKNRVTPKTTLFFGASKITVDEFSEKISDIVGDILSGQYETSRQDYISRNDKDEFELKSFMPSFRPSNQFEVV